MRSGVIITLILLSLAFLYVFVTNWKVYDLSLQAKAGDTKRETRAEPERDSTTKLLLANSLVTAVVAPISTKPSPSEGEGDMITINVVGPVERGHPSTLTLR